MIDYKIKIDYDDSLFTQQLTAAQQALMQQLGREMAAQFEKLALQAILTGQSFKRMRDTLDDLRAACPSSCAYAPTEPLQSEPIDFARVLR